MFSIRVLPEPWVKPLFISRKARKGRKEEMSEFWIAPRVRYNQGLRAPFVSREKRCSESRT